LQLKQHDGSAPLLADIQSNNMSVRVTQYYNYMRMSSLKTLNLTVPSSGIVTMTVPVDTSSSSITLAVGSLIHAVTHVRSVLYLNYTNN